MEAKQDLIQNYWIRAETLEINTTSNSEAPYANFNHQALAVLHYQGSPTPTGAVLGTISHNPPNCDLGCRAANCPFESFHESYNITCLHPAQDFRLLNPTSPDILPNPEPDEGQEYFFNFGYAGKTDLSANINGRLFQFPTFSLATQGDKISNDTLNLCPDTDYSCFDGCRCTHMLKVPFGKTVRFVLTSIGDQTHPIHLHGHSFWVVDSGYGYYNSQTGFIEKSTNALSCLKDQSDFNNTDNQPCTTVRWRDGYKPKIYLNASTPRMDTILVPAGSYVVIQFRSDNPGYWFFHCHIQEHLLEGMAMVVAVDPSRQNPPPEGMHTCGDFSWTVDEFNEKLKFDPSNPASSESDQEPEYCQCLRQAELIAVVLCSVAGFVALVVVPMTCCCVLFFLRRRRQKNYNFDMPVASRAADSGAAQYAPLQDEK